MNVQAWTFVMVGFSFALYIGVAIWSKAKSTGDFYVAGSNVHPIVNGLATAADWMSAASFISMAGLIAFMGRDGSVYLLGWTGGYVLLAMLLAPYLRKFGKYTVPDFVGDRYYSHLARIVAVVCAIFVSFTYVAGQMRGVGIVFSRFLNVNIDVGVLIGMGIVFFYAVLGGMKGITYTQVAQYCVLIFAYLVPAIFISILITENVIPQMGLVAKVADGSGMYLLDRLNGLNEELGFNRYTDGSKSTIDVFFITAALMLGTAGLPHVIIRFYTVRKASEARISAGWALLFIAILYTTAPAVAVFARTNLLKTVRVEQNGEMIDVKYEDVPEWFKNWEATGLIKFEDKNGDGAIQYRGPKSDVQNELTIDRGHHGAGKPRNRKIAKLDSRISRRGRFGGCVVYGCRFTSRHLHCYRARFTQRRVRARVERKTRVRRGAYRRGHRCLHRRLFRNEPTRVRWASGSVRFRARRELLLPSNCDGHFLQTDEQSRRGQRDDCRHHIYGGLHRLFQIYQSDTEYACALVVGHFAGGHRHARDGVELHRLHHRIGTHTATTRRSASVS